MGKWLRSRTCITFEVAGRIARITLNRPEKRNALSKVLLRELHSAMLEADDLKSVRCVILAGAGRDFSSGYDFRETEAYGGNADGGSGTSAFDPDNYRSTNTLDDDSWALERMNDLKMIMFDMHKPIIAKVQGNCLAGGTDLALLCDMLIVAADARIGFPATRSQGSPPNHLWLHHVGPQWAKRLLMTGDAVRGKDAVRIGLALKAVDASRLDREVEDLARRIALVDSDLLSAQKRIVNLGLELMGARTMQRIASEMDARAHLSQGRAVFKEDVAKVGLKEAVLRRDAAFGAGEVRYEE
jgi:enoyl-CoA hydratase